MGRLIGVVSCCALALSCAVESDDGGFGSFGSTTMASDTLESGSDDGGEGEEEGESGSESGSTTDGTTSTTGDDDSTSSDSSSDSSSGGMACGNGVIEGDEECDTDAVGDETCVGLGFEGGTLGCGVTCLFSTVDCYSCGDGVQNGQEECDQNDFGGTDCVDLGWDEGNLACNDDCTRDTSGCAYQQCFGQGQPCQEADDCCNTGCGKGGAFCIQNGQSVCCS